MCMADTSGWKITAAQWPRPRESVYATAAGWMREAADLGGERGNARNSHSWVERGPQVIRQQIVGREGAGMQPTRKGVAHRTTKLTKQARLGSPIPPRILAATAWGGRLSCKIPARVQLYRAISLLGRKARTSPPRSDTVVPKRIIWGVAYAAQPPCFLGK